MSWLTTTWLIVASACLTLAAIHAHVWIRQRHAVGNAAFALLAASVAGMGYVEVRMLHAPTIGEFGAALWWYQIPVWTALVALVCFVRLYLRAGRAWLGWSAIGLRTLALVVNFFSSPAINFREITSLRKITVFGDSVSVAEGVPNPWLAIAHLALVALILFIADATHDLWRRGERRRAVTIGGSLILFVTAGTMMAVVSFWGFARIPILAALVFLPIVVAMGFELSIDLIRAVRLSAELDAKTGELRTSEQKLALAAEAASAGLWSVDGESGRLWATPRALAMFGLVPDADHCIDDVLRRVHPEDRERVRAFAAGADRSDDRRTTIEYRVLGGDGEARWYVSLGRAHEGGPDAPRGLMGVTLDITDRKRAEDETARQRAELEHLSRVATLSELSGALAHELNQPLAIVMSNAEAAQRLLNQPAPDLAEIRAILDDIVAADERAGEVIRRLRGLLKRGAPNREPLSLNEVVTDVLKLMRADLIRRGISVELALDQSVRTVHADRVPLEQVLINVIGNACDAMAANAPGDRPVRIVTDADGSTANVRIVDAGSGLPAVPEQVFAPFYTTKPLGLGMGLAISRSIVAAHGGRLSAQPNADRGATFRISLPLTAEAA